MNPWWIFIDGLISGLLLAALILLIRFALAPAEDSEGGTVNGKCWR